MKNLNLQYKESFGFPCIVALRLHATRESVLAQMRQRLANDPSTEMQHALEQIGHITRGRLAKILNG
jgi:chitin deacetylase